MKIKINDYVIEDITLEEVKQLVGINKPNIGSQEFSSFKPKRKYSKRIQTTKADWTASEIARIFELMDRNLSIPQIVKDEILKARHSTGGIRNMAFRIRYNDVGKGKTSELVENMVKEYHNTRKNSLLTADTIENHIETFTNKPWFK